MAKALQIFKRKLTNLSSANPILWMRRLKADIHFDLTEAEPALGVPAWKILEGILGGKKKIPLIPLVNPGNGDTNRVSVRFHTLQRRQQLLLQERGVDQLYIAFGFVQGCWPDGSWVRTPLLYFPCTLEHNHKSWWLQAEESEAFVNPAFLLAYAFHFRLPVEESLFEKELDLSYTDAVSFLTALYQKLKASSLDIHFNQATFEQKVQSFPSFTKDTLPSGYQPGMLKIQPHLVLGLFPQSNSSLIPDFEYLEQYQVELENIFLKDLPLVQSVTERNLLCPLPVDGSQEECIRRIKSGESLVVQGPPGTGKSQLISNVMADAIGMGKSVLLVCQKRVALEVVQNRLSNVGLSDFIALWSDYKKDRERIYSQIASQIDKLEEVEKANSKLDTVVLERKFGFASHIIDQVSSKLEEWKNALFDTGDAGISIKELYSKPVRNLPGDFSDHNLVRLRWDDFEMFKVWLGQSWPSVRKTYGHEFALRNRRNMFKSGDLEFESIPAKWERLEADSARLFKKIKELQWNIDLSQWDQEIRRLKDLSASLLEKCGEIREKGAGFLLNFSPTVWLDDLSWNKVEQRFGELRKLQANKVDWPDTLILSEADLRQYLFHFESWKKHARWPLWWNLVGLFSKEVGSLRRLAKSFGDTNRAPMALYRSFQLFESHLVLTAELNLSNDRTLSSAYFEQTGDSLQNLRTTESLIHDIRKELGLLLPFFPHAEQVTWEKLGEYLAWLITADNSISTINQEWKAYFHGPPPVSLPVGFTRVKELRAVLSENKAEIREADKSLESVSPVWADLSMQAVRDLNTSGLSKTELVATLDDFWVQGWIKQIESRYPVLREVSTEAWQEDLQLLRDKITEKQELVSTILKLKLTEQTYRDLEHNRLRNRVTYRDLHHQVTKKRQRWPMRQLWEQNGAEILKLIPAWLATPDSVSLTWPMETRFDLVIFDEASQCFAESGIPSAFRARQLLVIGDDKQLPPNHLFSSRWDEESDDEGIFAEQESLLDLSKQFLPQSILRSHYRSHYPELITFSNRYFYQDKLECIPSASVYTNPVHCLRFHKVEGAWKNQRNEEEAEYLCRQVLDFLSDQSTETLGIITFNVRQQELIESMLDERADLEGITIPESWDPLESTCRHASLSIL